MAETYPGLCAYCGCGFVEPPLQKDNLLFCGLTHYRGYQIKGARNIPDEPKSTVSSCSCCNRTLFTTYPFMRDNIGFCDEHCYLVWKRKQRVTNSDKEAPEKPVAMINGLPLTVSPAASNLLAAVHFGFSQAVEMFKVVTQPSTPASPAVSSAIFGETGEDDILAPGVLDIAALWAMPPVQREAVLSQYGLQVATEPEPEPDPVHAEVAAATGLAPLGEKEEEE